MEKEFVPYELALDLKELGFDKPCILLYRGLDTQPVCQMGYEFKTEKNSDYADKANYWLTAPLYQQAFTWFREKYNLLHTIHCNNKGYFATITEKVNGITPCIFSSEIFNTYKEAELDCLKKLIEIVKEKK